MCAAKTCSSSNRPPTRPYFGYARQDRRTKARTPISAKLVANLIAEAGVERVLTMDLHAAQIQGFFDLPVDNLYASPIFALDILHHFGDMDDVMIVSPDVGGVARAPILNISGGSSVSSLFDADTLAPIYEGMYPGQ